MGEFFKTEDNAAKVVDVSRMLQKQPAEPRENAVKPPRGGLSPLDLLREIHQNKMASVT